MPDPTDFQQLAGLGAPGTENGYGYAQQLQGALAPASQQLGPTPRQRLPGEEELQNALQGFKEFQATLTAHNAAAQTPPEPTKTTTMTMPDGRKKVAIEGSADLIEYYGNAARFYQEALGGYSQQVDRIAQSLKAREEQMRSQPWVQLATALSANLAQAKDMPGWVQAAGRTAAQLNPTADQLQNQRLAVLSEGAGIAEKGIGLDIAQQRTMQEMQQQAMALEKQRQLQVEKASDDVAAAIKTGTGTIDAKAAAEMLTTAGATPKELESHMGRLGLVAKNVGDAFNMARADKAKAEARAEENLALAQKSSARLESLATSTLAAASQKAKEKTEAEKAIEVAAQAIASGDLSSIRDISSFRGEQRLLIFARAKKINPEFNVAETKRKIDMEQSFTVGKDGQGIQSFATFLEHAGEAADVLKNLYQSGSPLLNKPMNWIRKNAAGNPEYQRLLVSLEPVGKEFESFLLNQRALYIDDRRQIETFLNGNSSPKQIMAALNQMGKTAKDRYEAMNQRYKRTMKQDIQEPFGPDAIAGAAKIGIDLAGVSGATTSAPPVGARDAGGPRQKVRVSEEQLRELGFK